MLTRILPVAVVAVLTLAMDVAGQSRLNFRKGPSPAPTHVAPAPQRHDAVIRSGAGSRLVITQRDSSPRPDARPPQPQPAVSSGLALGGDGELHVEPRVLDAQGCRDLCPAIPNRPTLGGRRQPRSKRATQTSFEVPHPLDDVGVTSELEPRIGAEYRLEQSGAADPTIAMNGNIDGQVEMGEVYMEYPLTVLPTHFPYATKHCPNYPFDPWTGFCYERMCRYGLVCEKPCQCNACDFWGRGVAGNCVCSGGFHGSCRGTCGGPSGPAEMPAANGQPAEPNAPENKQPVRAYPKAPRNVPPPQHLLRRRN